MKIRVSPSLKSIDIKEGQSVLEACQENDIPIKSSCGGFGNCTDCKIKITYGEENLTEISIEEKKHLGNTFFITKERLGCQTYSTGDLGIEIIGEKPIQKSSKILRRKKVQEEVKEFVKKEPKARKDRRPRAFHYSEEE